jgi:hypothetical protein
MAMCICNYHGLVRIPEVSCAAHFPKLIVKPILDSLKARAAKDEALRQLQEGLRAAEHGVHVLRLAFDQWQEFETSGVVKGCPPLTAALDAPDREVHGSQEGGDGAATPAPSSKVAARSRQIWP